MKKHDEKFEPLGSNTKWFAGGNFNSQQTDVFLDTDQSEFYDISQGNYIRKAGGTSIVSSNVENAFSTTINLGHKITDKIELLTGLTYSDWQGEQLAYFDITEVKQTRSVTPAPAGGGGAKIETITNVSNLNDTLHTSFQFQSFEVPVMMRYKIENNVLAILSLQVFQPIYLLFFKGDNESTILDGSPRFQKSTAFEPTRINMIVGLGLGYKLNDNLVFRLEPNYRYGVPLKEDPFVRDDFSIWGLGTGLNFYF